MTEQDAWTLVAQADHGVLSVIGVEGYPYGMPMNHVLVDGALIFHGAVVGHRLDALRANPRACFTVLAGPEEAADEVPPDSIGTYRSAILFGTLEEMPPEQTTEALQALCRRYAPGRADDTAYFARYEGRVALLRMTVAHITGKRLLVT